MRPVLEQFIHQNERALARAITLIEAGDPRAQALLRDLRALNRRATVVGITGAPGAGKSTLTDALIQVCRANGKRVAVLAVDPSSPFSGGAILGDRIRMGRHHADRNVFVRSMATRGALGGLARAVTGVLSALEAFGFDFIFLETVGVGQSEVDIARVADHTVLVLTPAGGDAVQAFKAGIMEIADVYCINKADLPGADRLQREIRAAQELGAHDEHIRWAEIVQTVGSTGQGAPELLHEILEHRAWLGEAGINGRRLERARFELGSAIQTSARHALERRGEALLKQVSSGALGVEDAVRVLLEDALDAKEPA
jgi:LAO/AO transport system kinase